MSDYDRGAYTPQTDAPLAFDARSPRGRRPMPMALLGSGFILLLLVAAVFMYYRSGVRPAGGAPPTVGDTVAAVKTPPPPGAQKPGAPNLDVFVAENTPVPAAPTFAPEPEAPEVRPAPRPAQPQVVAASPVRPIPTPQAAPKASAPAANNPANSRLGATTAIASAPAVPAVPASQPTAPFAQPKAVATAPAAPAPVAAAGGAAMVQIGVFSTSARADTGYAEVIAAFPGQTSGKSKRVEPIEQGGRTLYRSAIGGFPSRAAAQAFCDALKASGRTCLVRG